MSGGPDNFLGLDAKRAAYETARFAALPIGYDSTASFLGGTRHGPRAIITASQQVELFDEELEAEFHHAGISTLAPLAPEAAGPQAMHETIFRAARRVVRDGKFLFGLGGEHSVTSGLVRAVAGKYKDLSVLQIDAHADLRESYQGTEHSHACVMRLIRQWAGRTVGVGIRNLSLEEHRYAKREGLSLISARQCHDSDDWLDRAIDALGPNVYVTIDIDGFDPAYAPGTGTPEPGGLDWYQVTTLLRLVAAERNVVGADIVEVLPVPGQVVTEFLAARLAYKLMGYVVAAEQDAL